MSRNFIKPSLVVFFTHLFFLCYAQEADSVPERHWALPDHAKLQFAGGTGFFSLGAGYSNKKGKLEGDLLYGYLPESIGGVTIHTLTAKGTWWPMKRVPVGQYEWKPLSTGVLVNYTFGEQYFAFSPRNYPFNYYKYPTALHAGLHLGSGIQTKGQRRGLIKQWALLGEVVTYDVEIISFAANTRSLGISDVISLGFAVQARF